MDIYSETDNLVTYTYDHLDRILYKNVYQWEAPQITSDGFAPPIESFKNVNPSDRLQKKLLYQDVYKYKRNSRLPNAIKRVYQPLIDFFSATRDGNNLLFKANITCRSRVIASGFIHNANIASLAEQCYYPPDYQYLNENLAIRKNQNAIGTISYSITSSVPVYVRAFAQTETGTLFSKHKLI